MPSLAPNFEYDIFISYRHNDNRGAWVTEFVNALREELASTIKEPLSIYFDQNPQDGLLETYDVDKSLEGKIKALLLIPIISQTYCDPKGFAWQNEFCAFNKLSKEDQFGRDIKLHNGNVASRILPIKIHDLDGEDKSTIENEIGGKLRAIEFIYKSGGVNRPLNSRDDEVRTPGQILYRDQVNKVANAVKEIANSILKKPIQTNTLDQPIRKYAPNKKTTIAVSLLLLLSLAGYFLYPKIFSGNNLLDLKQAAKKDNPAAQITNNAEAYDFYLKGKFYSNSETEADLDTSILYLNKAIGADVKFALAYAEVSYVYGLKNFWFDPKGGWDVQAVVAADKAFNLDPNLPEAIFAKAFSNWTLKNNFPHESVIRECNRALTLSPNLDRIHNQLGLVYMHVGLLEEGLGEAKIASSLDSYSGFDLGTLGSAYLFLKQYENTLHVLKQIPENFIGFPFRKSFLALALINLGREDEAKNLLLNALKIDLNNYATNSAYAILLAKQGDRTNAMRTIKIVENAKVRANHFHHAAYNIGIAYALLNEKEKSLSWLKWSAENGFPSYSTFKNDPLLKSMQDYPPFMALLANLKTEMGRYKNLVQENKP